jgi:hypothetical protein
MPHGVQRPCQPPNPLPGPWKPHNPTAKSAMPPFWPAKLALYARRPAPSECRLPIRRSLPPASAPASAHRPPRTSQSRQAGRRDRVASIDRPRRPAPDSDAARSLTPARLPPRVGLSWRPFQGHVASPSSRRTPSPRAWTRSPSSGSGQWVGPVGRASGSGSGPCAASPRVDHGQQGLRHRMDRVWKSGFRGHGCEGQSLRLARYTSEPHPNPSSALR